MGLPYSAGLSSATLLDTEQTITRILNSNSVFSNII